MAVDVGRIGVWCSSRIWPQDPGAAAEAAAELEELGYQAIWLGISPGNLEHRNQPTTARRNQPTTAHRNRPTTAHRYRPTTAHRDRRGYGRPATLSAAPAPEAARRPSIVVTAVRRSPAYLSTTWVSVRALRRQVRLTQAST
jgi:hypothetical protein